MNKEPNWSQLTEKLKERGLTCEVIDRKIQDSIKTAIDFRAVGFETLAKSEDLVGQKLKELKGRVCLLT